MTAARRERVLEVVGPDILVGDDGYAVFWPTENKGAYAALDLRLIADELDARNAQWDRQMQRVQP